MKGETNMAKGKELQETRRQGTPMHPLKIYKMYDVNGKIDVPCHWHDNVEILWIQKGSLSLMVKDILYTGGKGDVFYINPRELHGMNSLTQDCTYLAFIFPLQWLQSAQADEAEEKYLKPLGTMGTYITNCLPAQTAKDAVTVLKEIYTLYQEDGDGAWLGIKAGMLLFYYYIYRAGKPQAGEFRLHGHAYGNFPVYTGKLPAPSYIKNTWREIPYVTKVF